MIDVTIELTCSRKPGTLSRLIRDIKLFGLQYNSHGIKHFNDHCEIIIVGHGVLNCSREDLIKVLSDIPEITEVKSLTISRDGHEITTYRTEFSKDYIHAREPLSEAVLLSAEKRLAEILGPIASYLVEMAARKCTNAGQLYKVLARELGNDQEKEQFLAIIDDL